MISKAVLSVACHSFFLTTLEPLSLFKRVLGKVMLEGQNAFLPGRQILDGEVIVNEVLDLAKQSGKRCLALKVDFGKAHYSVSWSFIHYMLMRLGFNSVWRRWMRERYMANSIFIIGNGSPTSEFMASRRLKQGPPCFVPLYCGG